jgi:hypothetical protein
MAISIPHELCTNRSYYQLQVATNKHGVTNPQDQHQHLHRRENLKSHVYQQFPENTGHASLSYKWSAAIK